MKNHAFLIKAHKEPELVARIIKILAKENHFFFLHIDAKTKNFYDFVRAVDGINNIIFLQPRISVHHACVSMLECNLRLFREAFSFNKKIDYFHLISGQDYPLRSNEVFDSFFENNDKSYMGLDTIEFRNACMPIKYSGRVNYWWLNKKSLISKIYNHSLMKPISYIFRRDEIPDLWGGWEWCSLTYPVVKFILEQTEKNPQFLSRFNHTSCSDELYIPTIAHKYKNELNIEDRTPLRYVSWIPKSRKNVPEKKRPYILNEEDYYDIINSQAFFCRKIDSQASKKLLDLIDQNRNAAFDFNHCDRIICAEIV